MERPKKNFPHHALFVEPAPPFGGLRLLLLLPELVLVLVLDDVIGKLSCRGLVGLILRNMMMLDR
jgi:hypothetical protein